MLSIGEEEAHVGTQGGDLFSHEEVERGDLCEHCAFRWAVILVIAAEIGPSAGAGGDAQQGFDLAGELPEGRHAPVFTHVEITIGGELTVEVTRIAGPAVGFLANNEQPTRLIKVRGWGAEQWAVKLLIWKPLAHGDHLRVMLLVERVQCGHGK